MNQTALATADLLAIHRNMTLIRLVEEGIASRYREDGQLMRCPVHLCLGQEAIASGVGAHLRSADGLFGAHRSHGHYLAKGGALQPFLDELYGRRTGCCRGRGGSMHLVDQEAGFLGATPIVGDTVPLAVGVAWAERMRGSDNIGAVFFGDGCFEEGVVHEVMNFAVLKKIPVLFLCENNQYACYTHVGERQPERSIHGIARAHGLAVWQVDGNDVEAVWAAAGAAVARARAGEGPAFLEFATYRMVQHCGPDDDSDLGYHPAGAMEAWRERCPLRLAEARLIERGVERATLDALRAEVQAEVDAGFERARAAPFPDPETRGDGVFAPAPEWPSTLENRAAPRLIRCAQAIREATAQALAADERVFLIGEGVPEPHGIFGTTKDLIQEFGPARVMDMPLSENGLTGACIGAALAGMRPVMVHQRIDFLYLALDQLANVAAKWHYLFNRPVPLVLRTIIGRGWGQGPQHAQSLQALFGHIPGLKVVMPVTARDAKGMLLAAIDDPNPVLFIEHRWLHGVLGDVPEAPYRLALDRARLVRKGRDVTVAAYSYMVLEALKAAEVLAEHDIEVEVIDLSVVQPLDLAPVLASVRKTGRLVVADTGWTSCGMGAEVVARVTERSFLELDKAPVRVAYPDHPLPTSPVLARYYDPDAESIARAILPLLRRKRRPNEEAVFGRLHRQGNRDVPNAQFTGPF
ncbi:Pyruvate dehydrogenase E1 component subunit [Candidatus Magnetaquicoccaceae bacterium FCR-1]|uniref:Pyruvate dehydrogenase E1 component subunit n=1 Tax=Candidatus Magnetaquiglobus chichijimensis TaxID=3141448 RepID=A0ABQ0CBX6_9PROT